MTTIAAQVDAGGTIWMAGDTATQVNDNIIFDGAVKVAAVPTMPGQPDVAIGVTGSAALGRFPQYAVGTLPIYDEATPLQRWADQVADLFTDWAIDRGLTSGDDVDGKIMLGHRGRLWTIGKRFAVPMTEGMASLGSGCDLALGAIAAFATQNVRVSDAVELAVTIACTLDAWSHLPVTLVSV